MKQQQNMDITGALLLIGFAIVLAFNQVVIKVTNDGFQPAFQAGMRSVGALFWVTRHHYASLFLQYTKYQLIEHLHGEGRQRHFVR